MKAEELMIGDWVYGCTDPYETDRDKKKYPVKVIRIDADGDTMTEGENPFTEPYEDEWWNLEPIPLTPEILEKNGFERPDARSLYFTKSDDYFDVAIHEITDSIWYFEYQNCEFNLPPCSVLVAYVHELQHALRLCGIDKEIVL